MIIDDTSDIKQSTWLKSANFTQEFIRLLRIGLYAILVRIKPISSLQRVFQVLFKLIDRANPILYFVGSYSLDP